MVAWAYQFSSPRSLYEMEALLNQRGLWQWRIRDCAWYPDFLQTKPQKEVRICIYEVNPPGGPLYRCIVEVSTSEDQARASIDTVLIRLLDVLAAENRISIDSQEWPFD